MSKHGKNNRDKARHKPNNHKPKPKIDKPDPIVTDKPDPNTTLVTTVKHGEEDTVKLVNNQTGKAIVTDTDKAKIEAVKEAQRLYRQKRLEAQEAMRKAKEAFEALDGSEALKAIKKELEDKIEAKQAEVTKARETFKALVDEYNSLSVEYQELTGISKKAIKANSTGPRITANGSWIPTVKAIDKDSVKIIVKHKPTNDIFESSLSANGENGMISHDNWLELRHSFTKHYQTVYDSLDTNAKANFRAFLYPRLHNLISQVKAIADKID